MRLPKQLIVTWNACHSTTPNIDHVHHSRKVEYGNSSNKHGMK